MDLREQGRLFQSEGDLKLETHSYCIKYERFPPQVFTSPFLNKSLLQSCKKITVVPFHACLCTPKREQIIFPTLALSSFSLLSFFFAEEKVVWELYNEKGL